MAVRLAKGQKVDLTKSNPNLKEIIVGLSWMSNPAASSYSFDLDASAFLIGADGRVRDENDFVFYNNPSGGQGSVRHSGDNVKGSGEGDDEQIYVNLSAVPTHIQRIAFSITINDAQIKRQSFGNIEKSHVRILDAGTNKLLLNYELGKDFSIETAIVAAEIYRHAGEWKFNAIGSGFQGGLAALCHNFGLEVEDDQHTAGGSAGNTGYGNAGYKNTVNTGSGFSGNADQMSAGAMGSTPMSSAATYGQRPDRQNSSQPYARSSFQPYGQQSSPPPYGQSNAQTYASSFAGTGSQPYAKNYTTDYGQTSAQGGISCPRCHSIQVTAGKKGFGIGKALVGGIVLGPVGLLAGFIGSKNMEFACLSCRERWSAVGNANTTQWLQQQTESARNVVNKYMGKDLTEALVAGSALVTMADGVIEPAEREKLIDYFRTSQEMRGINISEVDSRFNYYIQRLQSDPMMGKAEALRAIGKLAVKPDAARLVVRLCCAIGFADGEFSPVEKQVVDEISRELNLEPREFIF